jgi:bifunctional N-acetylglucosamine-1-phosphate-uridyltransferase/glucosamine-1-phosphate-acetyltransferase GlmU-like protein
MEPLAQTTAVILAGSLGTRLRSVVADRPKVLATVNGRPFLAYLFIGDHVLWMINAHLSWEIGAG